VITTERMNQIAVRTIRQMLIAKKQFQPPAAKALPRLALPSSRQSRRRIRLQECEGGDGGSPCEERQAKRERAATAG
jgi:hypothetical protein